MPLSLAIALTVSLDKPLALNSSILLNPNNSNLSFFSMALGFQLDWKALSTLRSERKIKKNEFSGNFSREFRPHIAVQLLLWFSLSALFCLLNWFSAKTVSFQYLEVVPGFEVTVSNGIVIYIKVIEFNSLKFWFILVINMLD